MEQIDPIAKPEGAARTPLERVVALFGRKRAAQIVDLTPDALDKWKYRNAGRVPADYQAQFLAAARAEGLPLTAEDLIGAAA